jgi:uncharacterized integral membrane protein
VKGIIGTLSFSESSSSIVSFFFPWISSLKCFSFSGPYTRGSAATAAASLVSAALRGGFFSARTAGVFFAEDFAFFALLARAAAFSFMICTVFFAAVLEPFFAGIAVSAPKLTISYCRA